MTAEQLVQKIRLGEKYVIQDSMCKLISMMSENKETQEEIIKCLPEDDIANIMTYLEDSDPYFRKLTARFFLDLLYGNYTVQQFFCDALGILPSDGKVCINKIPEAFKSVGKSLLDYLDILKKPCPEEKQEELPYCWHFIVENVDRPRKQIGFISETEKGDVEDINQFIDPLHSMIGFIMRAPRAKKSSEKRVVEEADKTFMAKYYGNKVSNILSTSMKLTSSVNNSLDQSLHTRMLNKSKSPERYFLKNVSPVRKITAGLAVSSRINYPRASNPKTPMISQSICNTDRFIKQKLLESSVSHRGERAPQKHFDRSINQTTVTVSGHSIERENLKTLNHTLDTIKEKQLTTKELEFSLDISDNALHSKIVGSITDSQEASVKLLETSLNNSIHQGGPGLKSAEKSPDVSQYKIPSSYNEKKVDALKKTKKQEKIMNLKSKPLEVDKKYTSISFRDTNYSFSATTSPKQNLLSKILKDKPIVKEGLYSHNHKVKQDQKKLNVTAGASPISATKHITQKFSLALQKNKKTGKPDNEYANKKYAFHNSLMKSIDASDHSQHMTQIEEELAKENVHVDHTEKPQTRKVEPKQKIYHITNAFKSPISTPRTPTDLLKSTLSQNSKILNSRKSHDTSYLYNNIKRKSEAAIPLQNVKNRQVEVKER